MSVVRDSFHKMRSFFRLPWVLLLGAALFLAACKSDEEIAEEYYQSALEWAAQNETERALIELRNVFDHNGFHKDARMLYAGMQLENGDTDEAYAHYLRVVEQYPETSDARETLALIALERRNWDEVLRHGEAALALNPDSLNSRTIDTALKYREGLLDGTPELQEAAVLQAREILAEDPSSLTASRIVIDDLLRSETYDEGLAEIESALEYAPQSWELNNLKAQLLLNTGEEEGYGLQLEHMYSLFPGDPRLRSALIEWYLSREDFDSAIAFLRAEAGPVSRDATGNMAVVDLMRSAGRDADAAAELDRLVAEAEGTEAGQLYSTMRAWDRFQAGQQDDSIAEVQALLADAPPSEQTRRIRLVLARMLDATGNLVGAREQVEMVLSADPTQVPALKMRAEWLIRENDLGPAIIDLRAALDQDPEDAEIFVLMSEAHLRDGSVALAQERLASAVRVSGSAPPFAMRYARFLMDRNRNRQAQNVLVDALRRDPANLDILGLLGDVYLRQQDWVQAQTITNRLRQINTPVALKLAQAYQSSILLSQNLIDEGIALLRDGVVEDADGEDVTSELLLVRALLMTDKIDEAVAFSREQANSNPGNVRLALMHANVVALQGDLRDAERIYRDLLTREPDIEPAITQLQALLRATDRVEDAEEVIVAGLETLPQSRTLQLLNAYREERLGQYDTAIAIYEELYTRNNGDLLVVNNLASMLSNYRAAPEDIARAQTIVGRLEGHPNPAFHDTKGWLAYLRGDLRTAIPLLESAASAFPEDGSVHLHLGLAYAAADRNVEARRTLEYALEQPTLKTSPTYIEQAQLLLASL